MQRAETHPYRLIAIQRKRFDVFHNAQPSGFIRALHQDRTAAI